MRLKQALMLGMVGILVVGAFPFTATDIAQAEDGVVIRDVGLSEYKMNPNQVIHSGTTELRNEDYFVEYKEEWDAVADRLITEGKKYMGLEYVWGGETPAGFDCSGFTQYLFNTVGIDILRVATDQYTQSKKISPSQARKGDLIFFPDKEVKGKMYHVGIYLGGGKMLHSGGAANCVNISHVNIYGGVSIGRYIN